MLRDSFEPDGTIRHLQCIVLEPRWPPRLPRAGCADLNGDTITDILDFLDFIDAFGQGC